MRLFKRHLNEEIFDIMIEEVLTISDIYQRYTAWRTITELKENMEYFDKGDRKLYMHLWVYDCYENITTRKERELWLEDNLLNILTILEKVEDFRIEIEGFNEDASSLTFIVTIR